MLSCLVSNNAPPVLQRMFSTGSKIGDPVEV
jgi:hypothetical protein